MPTVQITLTATVTGSKTVMSISADPEKLDLAHEGDQVDIDWTLDNTNAAGWTFAAQGIDIKGHGSKFSDHGGSGGGKKHGWRRNARDGHNKTYKYAINVENATNGTTLSWDPFIVNN